MPVTSSICWTAQSSNFVTNSVPIATQLNAAGNAALALPFINADNALSISQPILCQGVTPASNILMFLQALGTMPNGASMCAMSGTGTGTIIAFNANVNTSGKLQAALENSNATGTSEHAIIVQEGGGDAVTSYRVYGGTYDGWTVGIDNSDANAFVISSGWALGGAENRVRIDRTTHVVDVGGPVRLKSYTVANAPSASAAGTGAMIYVSNGDAGSPCLAVSDGSDWKRIPLGAPTSAL